MDHFGIGNALMGMAYNFFALSRSTGRSTLLLESVQDGDRIIVAGPNEKQWYEHKLRQRQAIKPMNVTVQIVSPLDPARLFSISTSTGRTIFDHTWLEHFYMEALRTASQDIDRLQRESSGRVADPGETQVQADIRMHFPYPPGSF